MEVGISLPPFETAANTEMARLAGCSQLGQSAPVASIDWSLSNLWSQVGQRYSYRGKLATPRSPVLHRNNFLNRTGRQNLN